MSAHSTDAHTSARRDTFYFASVFDRHKPAEIAADAINRLPEEHAEALAVAMAAARHAFAKYLLPMLRTPPETGHAKLESTK